MMQTDILIIGGGASGLAAAVCAYDTNPRLSVTLCERLPRTGKKLLATGNGRCNIMNELANPEAYYGDKAFTGAALGEYRQRFTKFWDRLGLTLSREDEGRVYPACNQTCAVLDVLRYALADRGIEELVSWEVTRITPSGAGFTVSGPEGEIRCKRLILASGGKAGKNLGENDSFERLLKPFGHGFIRQYPGLTCLTVPRDCVAGLKGVRLRGEITLMKGETALAAEKGEVLFQDEALSGIAAMQLSLAAAGRTGLTAVLSPLGPEGVNRVLARAKLFKNRCAGELMTGEVNRLIALLALKRARINPACPVSELSRGQLEALGRELSRWCIPVLGTGDFSQAQVMLGGADTRDFCPETMQSLKISGLYACGELLNVTGPCGGYNLEWAWASGMLAGRKAAESL